MQLGSSSHLELPATQTVVSKHHQTAGNKIVQSGSFGYLSATFDHVTIKVRFVTDFDLQRW